MQLLLFKYFSNTSCMFSNWHFKFQIHYKTSDITASSTSFMLNVYSIVKHHNSTLLVVAINR